MKVEQLCDIKKYLSVLLIEWSFVDSLHLLCSFNFD